MIVEEIMQTNVYTLQPTDKVIEAVRLMREKKIRHFPIVNENGEVVGIVTITILKMHCHPVYVRNRIQLLMKR